MERKEIIFRMENGEFICRFPNDRDYQKVLTHAIEMLNKDTFDKYPNRFQNKFPDKYPNKYLNTADSKHIPLKKMREFIESQPDFFFSYQMICQHFLGRVVSSDPRNVEDRRIYDNIWAKAKRIRKRIEKINKGKWIRIKAEENGFAQPVMFKFIREQ